MLKQASQTPLIDGWTHIFPPAYFEVIQSVSSMSGPLKRWMSLKPLFDLDERFRLMDKFAGYQQVLTPSMPAFDEIAEPEKAASLAQLMNDGLAELVRAHPDRFPYFVAGLSMESEQAAQHEIERAIEIGAIGFQLPTHVRGAPLDHEKFQGIWDAIAAAGRPVWLHPIKGPVPDYPTEEKSKFEIWWCFGWPYESTVAMSRLALSGLFDSHPHLRILTHHMGGMIPFFSGRIAQGLGLEMGSRTPPSDAHLLPKDLKRPVIDYFKAFFGDTSLSGAAGALSCGLDFFGKERVFFATDFPFDAEGGTYLIRETIRSFSEAGLSAEDVVIIANKNINKLAQVDFTSQF
ncbi:MULTISPECIES: amidohydrolase family protein [unclassified Sinorhizobium]|uniref:amidohydrolase family protein n=1 Tax=unclassified Sinorhizobium TaxID=2613772 RepID=UPI0035246AD4